MCLVASNNCFGSAYWRGRRFRRSVNRQGGRSHEAGYPGVRGTAQRPGSLSESVVQLAVSKRAIGIGRIDFLDNIAAHRVSEIQAEREAVFPFIVAANVVQGGERLSAIRRPAIETKA